MSVSFLSHKPLLMLILGFNLPKDYMRISLVCKLFNHLAKQKGTWKRYCANWLRLQLCAQVPAGFYEDFDPFFRCDHLCDLLPILPWYHFLAVMIKSNTRTVSSTICGGTYKLIIRPEDGGLGVRYIWNMYDDDKDAYVCQIRQAYFSKSFVVPINSWCFNVDLHTSDVIASLAIWKNDETWSVPRIMYKRDDGTIYDGPGLCTKDMQFLPKEDLIK